MPLVGGFSHSSIYPLCLASCNNDVSTILFTRNRPPISCLSHAARGSNIRVLLAIWSSVPGESPFLDTPNRRGVVAHLGSLTHPRSTEKQRAMLTRPKICVSTKTSHSPIRKPLNFSWLQPVTWRIAEDYVLAMSSL